MYNPKEFEEKILPEAGDKIKAKIIQIDEGCLKEFVSEDAILKWGVSKDAPSIHIIAETSEGDVRKRVIVLPEDNKIHPQSNLGKWKTTFKEYPHVNQEIFLLADSKGFYQFPKL